MNRNKTPLSFTAQHEKRPLMVMEVVDWGQSAPDSSEAVRDQARQWATDAYWQLLSSHKGHVVQRMCNGLMMEFADARSCVRAAFALAHLAAATDLGVHDARHLRLRSGAHLVNYSMNQDGPTGPDVSLTLGLTTLAQPGEFLMTSDLRDHLADGLDADFEDLGYRQVPSVAEPVHLFRAHPGQDQASDWASFAHRDLRPGLAIIPFNTTVADAGQRMIGDLIAEGVIARLSHSIGFRVIARQSTAALRTGSGLDEIEHHLGAAYILSGSYSVHGKQLVVSAELAEARSHARLWRGELHGKVGDLLQVESALLHELATQVAQALTKGKAQVRKALARPLPRLDSNIVLLTGIAMTHSDSPGNFRRAHDLLTELAARHPRLALPKAWLGMWHALNVIKGQSHQAARDAQRASEYARRALDAEPTHAMALAVEGYIHCQLLGNPQRARQYLDSAIEANPSEPMAWLFKSLYSTMWASSSLSVTEAYVARSLSPVDPLRYFFDLMTGGALFADGQREQAIAYFNRSLRASGRHVPTLRMLLTAQAELGRMEEGQRTLDMLRAEMPGLTVSSYLATGSADSTIRQRTAAAMRQLGLPER